MGKHAFLIMAYDRWNQLSLLLQLIGNERNDIYLHINANTKNVPFEQLKSCVEKYKCKINVFITMFAYMTMYYFVSFNITRQALAISIGMDEL